MSDQDHPERDDRVLAGEYALGLLPAEEAAAFEARLREEQDLRALYAAWAEDLAGMTDGIAPVTPPDSVLAGIESRLFKPARPPRYRGLWLAALAGAAAAVAAVVLVAMLLPGVLDPGPAAPEDPPLVADVAAEDRSLVVRAAYDGTDHTLFVEREAGAAPPGRALELWLIAGDGAPVSLGVLPEQRQAKLPVGPQMREDLAGGVLAISEEPPGGSPTGAPTGEVLATGQITNT
jgi:anti-sigma-K factor RskA